MSRGDASSTPLQLPLVSCPCPILRHSPYQGHCARVCPVLVWSLHLGLVSLRSPQPPQAVKLLGFGTYCVRAWVKLSIQIDQGKPLASAWLGDHVTYVLSH